MNMNGKEILQLLMANNLTAKYFEGVYASNCLPNINKYPCILIANIAEDSHPGLHWICIWFDKKKQGFFFDSYGLHPNLLSEHFTPFLNKFSKSFKWNKLSLQSNNSKTCGEWCIYFAFHVCRGMNPEDVCTSISLMHSSIRDQNVKDFVKLSFSKCNTFSAVKSCQCCIAKFDVLCGIYMFH